MFKHFILHHEYDEMTLIIFYSSTCYVNNPETMIHELRKHIPPDYTEHGSLCIITYKRITGNVNPKKYQIIEIEELPAII